MTVRDEQPSAIPEVEELSVGLPVEPSARTYTLASLVALVREGRVRVPHFQRGLRWGTTDVVALVDSVLRGFPIGSLLLWKRPGDAANLKLGEVHIEAPKVDEALFVIDGQQRITAFVNTFHPVAGLAGPFALVYDIKEKPFRVRPRRASEHESIPLPTLFDLGALLRWTRDNPQYMHLIDEVNEATTRLREFHIPAYEVRSEDGKALRDIYDRMNNAGKRLSRAEAFWGLFAPSEEDASRQMSLSSLQDHVGTALSWGRIDDDTVLRVFLARRGYDVTRDIHLEFDDQRRSQTDFPGENNETAHMNALEALERAVRFLRDECGVPHFSFLAYRYLLVVIARYFAHFPKPDPRNRELLKRWYWRAALAGPSVAKGSTTGAMRHLCSLVKPGEESSSVQALLEAVNGKPEFRPDPGNFRANHSSTHIMLCSMWDRGPMSPDSNRKFNIDELASEIGEASSANDAALLIYPRDTLPDDLKAASGNRVILPGIPDEGITALMQGDTLFAPTVTSDARRSHFLPGEGAERGTASSEQVIDLVVTRTKEIGANLDAFLSRMTARGMDDSRPLSDFDLDRKEISEVDGSDEQ